MAKRTSERHMYVVDGVRLGDAAHLLCSLREVLQLAYGLHIEGHGTRVFRLSLYSLVGHFTLTTLYNIEEPLGIDVGPASAVVITPVRLSVAGVQLSMAKPNSSKIPLFSVDMRGSNPGVTLLNSDPKDTNAARTLKQGKLF